MSKIQVNEIVNHFDTGAPDCPKGLTVTGFTTFTGGSSFSGDVSIGGTLTYEDVTNIDSVGIITAQSGVHYGTVGSGVTIDAVGAGTSLGFLVNGSERVRIDSSGRLLVGTSSARGNFFNSTLSANFQVEGTDHNSSNIAVVRNSNDTSGAIIVIGKSRGTTINSNTVVASGDGIGQISYQSTDGSEMVEAASIACQVDGTPGSNDMPGRLVFATTADGESTPTERMRIDSSGRLLIGTTTTPPANTADVVIKGGTGSGGEGGLTITRTNTTPASGNRLGKLLFADSSSIPAAQITGERDGGTWTSGSSQPSRLVFATTADGASSPTEHFRIHASGLITTKARSLNSTDVIFMVRNINEGSDVIFEASNASVPGISGPIRVSKNASTSRSINASGTVNQNGLDYAEYFRKSGDFTVSKGDVLGIDESGLLTNVFANAVSYCVKSTDPGLVGGDNWFTEPRPLDVDGNEVDSSTTEYTEWMERLETARQNVDRIAFAGQVPVNVMGATPGQYIVPVEDNGGISGIAKDEADLTLAEYMRAVGKVIAIEDDGRARIIVKVA